MLKRDSIYLGVILVLLGLVLFSFNRDAKPDTIITTKVDAVKIVKDTTIYKKKLVAYRVDSIRIDTISIPDTLLREAYVELVKKYNLTRSYSDTIYKDSLNSVILSEQCNQNEIFERKVRVSIQNRIINKTTTIEKNNYYNGLGLGAIVTPNSLTPSICYSTKNFVYLGGYDLTEKNIKIGLFYKFNFRK